MSWHNGACDNPVNPKCTESEVPKGNGEGWVSVVRQGAGPNAYLVVR
jgi:hypothetical protein